MNEGGRAPADVAASPLRLVITRLSRDERDLSVIDAIARASFDEAGFSAEKELERPWARAWAAREDASDASDAAPVGFLVTWHVADELHVLNVATAPEARRRGVATALMEAALEYATESGVRLVLLEVRRSNEDARRLYRRLGFEDTAVRRGYYADNGEDAIEMTLTLAGQAK